MCSIEILEQGLQQVISAIRLSSRNDNNLYENENMGVVQASGSLFKVNRMGSRH